MKFKHQEEALKFFVNYLTGGYEGKVKRQDPGDQPDPEGFVLAYVDIEKILKKFPAPYLYLLLDYGRGGVEYALEQAYKRFRQGESKIMKAVNDAAGFSPEDYRPVFNVNLKYFTKKLRQAGYLENIQRDQGSCGDSMNGIMKLKGAWAAT